MRIWRPIYDNWNLVTSKDTSFFFFSNLLFITSDGIYRHLSTSIDIYRLFSPQLLLSRVYSGPAARIFGNELDVNQLRALRYCVLATKMMYTIGRLAASWGAG